MKIDKDTQFAVGKMLRALDEADGSIDHEVGGIAIAKVEVDGQPFDGEEARAAFETKAVAALEKESSALLDKIEAKADSLHERFDDTYIGKSAVSKFVLGALKDDPEHVSHEAELEITLVSGETLKIPLDVVHLAMTRFLQRLSLTSEVASLAPVVGRFVAGSTSLISALASLAVSSVGRTELAEALRGMASKHLVLAGAGFVPLLSSAAPIFAAVADRADDRSLNAFPDAASVVALHTGTLRT